MGGYTFIFRQTTLCRGEVSTIPQVALTASLQKKLFEPCAVPVKVESRTASLTRAERRGQGEERDKVFNSVLT